MDIESDIKQLGTNIFEEAQKDTTSLWNAQYYTGKLIEWAMSDDDFRVALFRFVDVLPSLNTSKAILEHVQEYFTPVAHRIPGLLKWGLNIDPKSLMAKASATMVKKQVKSMAERFILGETPEKALSKIHNIRKEGMAFSIDLLGEAALSEAESKDYLDRYLRLIEILSKSTASWKEAAPLVIGHPSEQAPVNISVKLTALYSQTKGASHESAVKTLTKRLAQLVAKAHEYNCFINVDIEDVDAKAIILETVKNVYTSEDFRYYDKLGFVLQAYLRSTQEDLRQCLEWIHLREATTTIRLVKGAYWDTETIKAKLNGWPIPVWQIKDSSDYHYEKLSQTLLDNHEAIIPAFGSHNIRSLCHAICYAHSLGLDKNAYELQALYGMADPIKKAFVKKGYLVREYAPIGELIPGMGYLVRRLLENTSNKGFIRQGFHEHETPEALLSRPSYHPQDTGKDHLNKNPRESFFNWPLKDFAISENREALSKAIENTSKTLEQTPASICPIIEGKAIPGEDLFTSTAPHDKALVLANIKGGSATQAIKALTSLHAFFPTWRGTPVEQRAEILFKTAEVLEKKRNYLTSLMVLEVGKPWAEADGDVCEAIDFLHYYALQAKRLFRQQKLFEEDGEDDFLFYEPRGVCVTIGPWNFPLAIPCGMFAAALVTGNCALLKPAEQSTLIAWELFKAFSEAGLPENAASFLPGMGEAIGPILTQNPLTSTIVFTGSRAVGLSIGELAAKTVPEQEHVKRIITEMGGKNAVIVDEDADLDQAVKGVIHGAFGYSGQKCSATSRVIVHEAIYERFCKRLKEAVKSLVVGPPTHSDTFVGPVIDEEAHQKLLSVIARNKKSFKILAQCDLPVPDKEGYYIPPTVFWDVAPDSELAQEEFFGPILGVIKVSSFSEALAVANKTRYGLTGSIYSRSPKNLKLGVQEFRVGNLYLNKPSTGALVGRQPFGGFKMSGVGSKAGGPDYLLQFVIPRAVCENTMRQGFAPMKHA